MICAGRYEAIDDIKRHIVTVGSKSWAVVQARHPDVSPASFWRFVREAKRDLAAEDMQVVCEQGGGSRDVAVSEANGVPRRIDFLGAYRDMFADVAALRQSALNADGSVRSPAIFDRSIKRRLALIAQSVKLSQQIYAVRNMQMFFDTLVDEIATESPELRRRMLARLRQFAAADPGR
jgi:hypothetical protein